MTGSARQALGAAVLYTIITGFMTWPLVSVMHHEIAADMGDPVFVCWILLWTGGQVMAFLSGDLTALSRYWHGNIFYSEPLTIAYSEHFTAQMLQSLPVLAATNNVVLTYNLLFLATFVLSGLGTFLLVRDLTGRPLAAFAAGLAFAFAPYRIDQLPHLQILSAQWMPLVLYGFRRFLETGRRRALVGGSAALIAQNLSCGYYIFFFAPFAGAYVLYELVMRKRLLDFKAWRAFGLAALVVLGVTLPFLTPYMEVRKSSGVGVRTLGEITMFSADTYSFVTASAKSRVWGTRMNVFPKAEGQAFPGLTILILAGIGVGFEVARHRRRRKDTSAPPDPPWRQVLTGAIGVLLAAHLFATVCVLIIGGFPIPVDGVWALSRRAPVMLQSTAVILVAWLLIRKQPGWPSYDNGRSPMVFYAIAALVAALLAMGPMIAVNGIAIAPGPYAWLMNYVPGFDGLRVPSRYVMVVALFLAVLAGLGASALIGRARKAGTICVLFACVFILAETWPGRLETNVRLAAGGLDLTPRVLHVGNDLPPVYKVIRDSDRPIVLVEFPFGVPAWDLHSVYYAGHHRQRLVNGYSGFFPETNQHFVRMFDMRRRDPKGAWRALLSSGATHVLVHEAAYPEGRQKEVSDWLRGEGATEILADGTNRLFTIR